MNIKTNKIKVFPSSFRDSVNDPESRLFTEANVTRQYHILCANTEHAGSFVITDNFDSKKDFEFILSGYYFKLDASIVEQIFEDTSVTYNAYINLKDIDVSENKDTNIYSKRLGNIVSNNEALDIKDSSDTDYNFEGLIISTTDPENYTHKLCLLDEGQIPEESKIKFRLQDTDLKINSTRSLEITTSNIDFNSNNKVFEFRISDSLSKITYELSTTNSVGQLLLNNTDIKVNQSRSIEVDNIVPRSTSTSNLGNQDKKFTAAHIDTINTSGINIRSANITGYPITEDQSGLKLTLTIPSKTSRETSIKLGENIYVDSSIIPTAPLCDLGAGEGSNTKFKRIYGTKVISNDINTSNINASNYIKANNIKAHTEIEAEKISTSNIQTSDILKLSSPEIELNTEGCLRIQAPSSYHDVEIIPSDNFQLKLHNSICDGTKILSLNNSRLKSLTGNVTPSKTLCLENNENPIQIGTHKAKVRLHLGEYNLKEVLKSKGTDLPIGYKSEGYTYTGEEIIRDGVSYHLAMKPDKKTKILYTDYSYLNSTSKNLLSKSILALCAPYSNEVDLTRVNSQISTYHGGDAPSVIIPETAEGDFNFQKENLIPLLSVNEVEDSNRTFEFEFREDVSLNTWNILPGKQYQNTLSYDKNRKSSIGNTSQPFECSYIKENMDESGRKYSKQYSVDLLEKLRELKILSTITNNQMKRLNSNWFISEGIVSVWNPSTGFPITSAFNNSEYLDLTIRDNDLDIMLRQNYNSDDDMKPVYFKMRIPRRKEKGIYRLHYAFWTNIYAVKGKDSSYVNDIHSWPMIEWSFDNTESQKNIVSTHNSEFIINENNDDWTCIRGVITINSPDFNQENDKNAGSYIDLTIYQNGNGASKTRDDYYDDAYDHPELIIKELYLE